MDQSKPLLLEAREEQRKLMNATLTSQIEKTFSRSAVNAPSSDAVNSLLITFQKCHSQAVKMDVFRRVLDAINSTDDIAIQFYQALPEGSIEKFDASRSGLRYYIWIANCRIDNGLGLGFGEHVISTQPRGPLVKQGASALYSALIEEKRSFSVGGFSVD